MKFPESAHTIQLIGMLLVFLFVGAMMVPAMVDQAREYRLAHASRSWRSTPGYVIESTWEKYRSRSRRGLSRTRYRAKIAYEYTVDGREYVSQRVALPSDIWFRWHHAERLQRFPFGSKPRVFYDPAKPSSALLETGISSYAWLAALVLPALGIAIIVGIVKLGRILWRRYRVFRAGRIAKEKGPQPAS